MIMLLIELRSKLTITQKIYTSLNPTRDLWKSSQEFWPLDPQSESAV
jgi:hypothetical protein